MTTRGLLAVFTEGDRIRGLGHVSRCSAYAQAWLSGGGKVCWFLDGDAAAAAAVGAGQDVSLRRWQEGGAGFDVRPAVALVDSYVASLETMERIARAAEVTVFIDDLNRLYPRGVIVVHPAPGGSADVSGSGAAEWLQGPSWQPLRPPFWDLPPRTFARSDIGRVLVVFGGGDLHSNGVAMARLASKIYPSAEIDLVLGAGHSMPEAVPNLTVHRSIDAGSMASLMLAADIAISGAGQTVFELARCGTPAVLVGIADNQQVNLDHWPGLCGYVSAGQWDAADLEAQVTAGLTWLTEPSARQSVSVRAAGVVDGQGVRRLFDYLDRSVVQEPG